MAQSLINGHLPYVHLWDNKPPLAFAFYSVVIELFGKDLVGIRLAGAICVMAVAFLVYLTAQRICGKRSGLIAAILCIPGMSLITDGITTMSGQNTMTEHVALVPLMGAIYLLICNDKSLRSLFMMGILMATATLIRMNMAYAVVVIGLYIAIRSLRAPSIALRRICSYAVGGGLIVALTCLPYLLTRHFDALWISAVVAPLKYSVSQLSLRDIVVEQTLQAIGIYMDGAGYKFDFHWFNIFMWLCAFAGMAALFVRWKSLTAFTRNAIIVLTLGMLATAAGIVKSGATAEHYMIQLVPFTALYAAFFLARLPNSFRSIGLAFGTGILLTSLAPVSDQYKVMVDRALAHEGQRFGPAYEIADYLHRENPNNRPVYMLTDHIVYWFTNWEAPTRLAHPSNIGRRYLLEMALGQNATTESELDNIFQKTPEFVVLPSTLWFLDESGKHHLNKLLDARYTLAIQIQKRKIYRIKSEYRPQLD